MKEESAGPSLPLRELGKYFRNARSDAHLTLDQVASKMEWSASKLSRLERGNPGRLTTRDIEALCELLEFEENQKRAMIGLVQKASGKFWWHSYNETIPQGFNVYVGMERSARHLEIYRPDIVPGLLQTPEYARVLDRAHFQAARTDEQELRIAARMKRKRLFTRKLNPATVSAVIHEAVLHTVVGSGSVMAEQSSYLAEVSTRPNVDIRVLPFTAGYPVGYAVGPYIILEFNSGPAEPTVVYVENLTGDLYLEGESDLTMYRAATAAIQRTALDAVSSRSLLRQMAKEYRR
ncbi:helix-turn-helix domain-containing protein [Nocardia cyriacigeorgica]|nr:helix-turn-helix domain-containing protein [Nocardia cyriacigeorgica]